MKSVTQKIDIGSVSNILNRNRVLVTDNQGFGALFRPVDSLIRDAIGIPVTRQTKEKL